MLTDQERAWRATSEAALQRAITVHAQGLGYRCCHVRPAQVRGGRWVTPTSDPGFPDLWMLRGDRLVVLELKAELDRRVRPGQAEWIEGLDTVTEVTARFARPSDADAVCASLR